MKQARTLLGGVIIVIACFSVYLCWGMLTPFVISLAIAYLWSPLVSFIESKWNLPRWIIALGFVVLTVGILLSIILVLMPLIYHQVLNFIELAPHYKDFIDRKVMPLVVEKLGAKMPDSIQYIRSSMVDLANSSFDSIIVFIKKIWTSRVVIVDLLWFMILVPFIVFHLIKDWSVVTFHIKNSVPVKKQRIVHQFLSDLDNMISGVIRGQLNVCFILAIYYTTALSLIGLNYSVFLGMTTGLVSFIPFVGFSLGFLSSLIVAHLQVGSPSILLLTALVFLVGGALDTGFISPKLIGKRIGLHPVWIIFSILVGGKLFGFAGMFIAIPCGATIGIIIRMVLKHYYKSELYISRTRK